MQDTVSNASRSPNQELFGPFSFADGSNEQNATRATRKSSIAATKSWKDILGTKTTANGARRPNLIQKTVNDEMEDGSTQCDSIQRTSTQDTLLPFEWSQRRAVPRENIYMDHGSDSNGFLSSPMTKVNHATGAKVAQNGSSHKDLKRTKLRMADYGRPYVTGLSWKDMTVTAL